MATSAALDSAQAVVGEQLRDAERPLAAIAVRDVSRRFGEKTALEGVSLTVSPGEIAALLGPNGAGKTTLLRIVCGLIDRDSGSVRVLGVDTQRNPRLLHEHIGLVPSGDRSFYLRLSGLENLIFFGRLHGLSRREAVARSLEVLEQVGLRGAERERVGVYSHGMQKRLSVARALLRRADVLLIDEATHDLDPEGGKQIRQLIGDLAGAGAAVVWATQRLDEIRGFADSVTLLRAGRVRFCGSVPELMSFALPRRYVLRLRNGAVAGAELEPLLQRAVGGTATIRALREDEGEDFLLSLGRDVVLGDALSLLLAADVRIEACREERSQIEEAFIQLSRDPGVGS